jgi:Fe-S-cluster containining protein
MTNNPKDSPEVISATVTLSGPDWQLQTTISVPKEPTRLRQLLPVAQSFADAVVGSAVNAAESQGEKISCKKGCGACCRQLVPIAETEARHIRDVVETLPEPRRTEIRARFAEARRRLEATGLLEKLRNTNRQWEADEGISFGLRYFAQGIPCPFLEEESCSIYADRPIACREYLVTSPAENCARPTAETVQCVPLPLKVWTAIARFDKVPPTERFIRWVPLILAPEWAEAHPDEPPPRPGPELLQELFEHMRKTGNALTRPGELPSEQDSSLVRS